MRLMFLLPLLIPPLWVHAQWAFVDLHVIHPDSFDLSDFAVADLDGDGDPDVLVADFQTDIDRCTNTGGGDFLLPEAIASDPRGFSRVVVRDLDGDGDGDLIRAHVGGWNWSRVSVQPNLGGGSFGTGFALATMDEVSDFGAGDLDGDGDVDLVVTDAGVDKVFWIEQVPGGWAAPVALASDFYDTRCVDLADLDGDGDLDIVAGSASIGGEVSWIEQLGGGFFGPKRPITNEPGTEDVVAVDLEPDGDMDVLIASRNGHAVWAYLNTGSGTFHSHLVAEVNAASMVAAADLDGDGDLDIVSSGNGMAAIFGHEQTGPGTFGDKQLLVSDPTYAFRGLHAADMDGDGDVDLVYGSDRLRWIENTTSECPAPIIVGVNPLGGAEVRLGWSAVPQAVNGYKIRYREGAVPGSQVRWSKRAHKRLGPLRPDSTYRWAVRAECANGPSAWSAVDTFRLSGVGDRSTTDWWFGPNPVRGTLNVRGSGVLEMWDVQGQLVLVRRLDGSLSLSVARFPRGLYALVYRGTDGTDTRRLVLE